MTGYTVTITDKVIEAKALPSDVSSQKAELIVLTDSDSKLSEVRENRGQKKTHSNHQPEISSKEKHKTREELSKGKKVNIWTDSKYAFSVVHTHGAIWKERELITSQGNEIKQSEQILTVLQSIWKPSEVAIMHFRGYQKGKAPPELGNCFADETAKEVAEKGILVVVPQKEIDLSEFTPIYKQRDNKLIKFIKAEMNESEWAVTPGRQVVVPLLLLREIAQKLQRFIVLSRPIGLDTPAHPFQPGDWAYVKGWDSDLLQAKRKGPFQVLVTTLTVIKVAGKGPWIH
ncbi:hypothetical protein HGM15179_017376 [Zosterops borbonicus]|uniref:RNase H type-1 domain-containing protein n=1 Tax=Zosterops borbonicus TaxID=364589 RepID=A0A8K1G170_9PASS|nr:hypothetical protein HGM15179_017376 [Zosterops borbonicus]